MRRPLPLPFRSRLLPPLDPLEHRAADTVARARGRTLVLWPATIHRPLPAAVTSVDHLHSSDQLSGSYDSIVSIGQLGTATDLAALIEKLRPHLGDGILSFCEPTIASDRPSLSPPHDVTTALWAAAMTVFDCRRFQWRHRLATHEYCWGLARITPSWVPATGRIDSRPR